MVIISRILIGCLILYFSDCRSRWYIIVDSKKTGDACLLVHAATISLMLFAEEGKG